MARWKGTTTERGLGAAHIRRRKALLPAAIGTPCPGPADGIRSRKCTGIIINGYADLDHTVPRALGGTAGDRIICSSCNRAAGARLGNKLRAKKPKRSREW